MKRKLENIESIFGEFNSFDNLIFNKKIQNKNILEYYFSSDFYMDFNKFKVCHEKITLGMNDFGIHNTHLMEALRKNKKLGFEYWDYMMKHNNLHHINNMNATTLKYMCLYSKDVEENIKILFQNVIIKILNEMNNFIGEEKEDIKYINSHPDTYVENCFANGLKKNSFLDNEEIKNLFIDFILKNYHLYKEKESPRFFKDRGNFLNTILICKLTEEDWFSKEQLKKIYDYFYDDLSEESKSYYGEELSKINSMINFENITEKINNKLIEKNINKKNKI